MVLFEKFEGLQYWLERINDLFLVVMAALHILLQGAAEVFVVEAN